MIKQLISLFIVLSSTSFAQIPTFAWVKQLTYPGFGSVTGISNVTTDAAGNAYIIGSFQGTVDINPGAATLNITAAGSSDIFIEKLSSTGAFLWVKTIGGTGLDSPSYIQLDSLGNIFITGSFQNTVDFNPGTSTVNLTSAGGGDIFLLKLDNAGNYIFAKRFGGTSNDYGSILNTDLNGNIYLSGTFSSPSINFSGHTISFLGNFDSYLVKLDPLGTATWALAYYAQTFDMALDDSANIYLTGNFYDQNIDFDPGVGTYYMSVTGGISDHDFFLLKLNTNGDFVWVKKDGSSIYDDKGTGIGIDSQGNIITSMDYSTNAVQLAKWTPGGTYIYLNTGGSVTSSSTIRSMKLIVDAADKIILSGSISGNVSWSGSQGTLSGFGGNDVFAQKFTNVGAPIAGYEIVIGDAMMDRFNAFSVDYHGGMYLIGSFQGTVDFNYSSSAINNLTSIGSNDIFILKLAQPTLGSINLTSNNANDFSIQPNPFNANLNIHLALESEISSISIFTIDGKLMFNHDSKSQLSDLQINTSNWPKGIYFANIINEQGQKNLKLIKN
jgi:hypothetical protein